MDNLLRLRPPPLRPSLCAQRKETRNKRLLLRKRRAKHRLRNKVSPSSQGRNKRSDLRPNRRHQTANRWRAFSL